MSCRRGLVAAGVRLRGHQNQPGPELHSLRPRSMRASLQDSDYNSIRGNNSHGNGSDDGRAKDKRHEKRNHNRPPCPNPNRDNEILFINLRNQFRESVRESDANGQNFV